MNTKRKERGELFGGQPRGVLKKVRTAIPDVSDQLLPANTTPSSKESNRKCFRITGIPLDWDKDRLIAAIQSIDSGFKKEDGEPLLFPACMSPTQTALLELDLAKCSKFFRCMNSSYDNPKLVEDNKKVVLVLDRHFLGLTQLNNPGVNITADVITVTGLAGHAYGSWMGRTTGRMWPKDFLPEEVGNIRVLTYGYNSSLTKDTGNQQWIDYRRGFIEALDTARSSCMTRPIIFVAHSMGGLLVLQALLQCKSGRQYRSIFDSTRAILFFATPHRGSQVDELLEIAQRTPLGPAKAEFIKQLQEGSNFLSTQLEDITNLWDSPDDIRIASFYESMMTATVSMSPSGALSRDGKMVQIVKKDSALLFWPSERRIPVESGHSDIVKFDSDANDTYRKVVKYIVRWVKELQEVRGRLHNM